MEAGDLVGPRKFLTNIVVPDHLAVGGIEEGHAKATEVERVARRPSCVPLGLGQDVLRTEADALGLDDAEDSAAGTEGVVNRAVGGGEFLDVTSGPLRDIVAAGIAKGQAMLRRHAKCSTAVWARPKRATWRRREGGITGVRRVIAIQSS